MNDLSVVIAVVGCVLSVATFCIGRQTAGRSEGKEAGSLAKDIEYIKESIGRIDSQLSDNVKRLEGRIDELSAQVIQISSTASRAHESAKMEHNRLNEHLERDHGMTVVKGSKGGRDD